MQDRYDGYSSSLAGPVGHGFAIVPDDGADLAEITRALYVGVGGSLSIVLQSGAELTLQGVAAGTVLPLRVRRLKASGTSASAVVGLV
ncbi:spike base protein, RCAP_Rcc01079 family [Devosia ginsengisoli]|uniref:Uncharacterized protein n=1 Tax=Devosia ginsengisoli TaxID=400770 RepID=A0A5B8LR52_9HYPH|nr:hypothetical protein [Devosia ginsengisoli]QDZ10718.1 hypothetical protein FPZ08_08100 [Devosia ginsengisoli]